jgi:parallel beta-helix repeat protein
MPLTQLAPPYPIFTDKNGDPLDAGYLYFGTANLNPETNPIQVYYDSALTQPAAQPLRTSNGYVMRNGSPALIYANAQFSVTVRDKNNALVIYSPVGYGILPGTSASSTDQMTYNQGGTGAVSRLLTARLQDRVSVKDFGAVGDGATNDTVAVKAAADFCKLAPKKALYFPAGTYLLTPDQVDVEEIETFGDGANSILRSTGAVGPILKAEGDPTSVYAGFGNDTYIHDLQLDGTTNSVATIGLSLTAQINCRVENIYVRRLDIAFKESALIRCSYNNIRDAFLNFSNAGRCNYVVYNNSGYRTADIDFTDSQIMANLYHFYLKGTISAAIDGYNIIGNTLFTDPDDPGYAHVNCIYMEFGGFWSNIAHNKLFEAGGNAISLLNSAHTNVSDNQIARCGRLGVNIANGGCAGIYLNSTSTAFNQTTSVEPSIDNNIIVGSRAEGIWVANTSRAQISGNIVTQGSGALAEFTYAAIRLIDCAEPHVLSNAVSNYNITTRVDNFNTFDVVLSGCRDAQVDHFPAYRVRGDSNQIERDFYSGGVVSRSFTQLLADGNTFANWTKTAFSGGVSAPVVTANAATAPDGTMTAAQIDFGATTPAGATTLDSILQYPITTTVTSADDYAFSVYLRAAAPTVIAMTILSNDATRSIVVIPVDTVWRRVWIRHTGNTAAATLICRLWNTPNSGAKTIFAWGANCNALGELFPMVLTQPHGAAQPTIGVRNDVNFGVRTSRAAAIPGPAYSSVGDRIINTPPVVGQPKAWSCTVSGSPGTWVSEGNL